MKCRCRLCLLEWESRKEGGPRACPRCKSYSWRGGDVVKPVSSVGGRIAPVEDIILDRSDSQEWGG